MRTITKTKFSTVMKYRTYAAFVSCICNCFTVNPRSRVNLACKYTKVGSGGEGNLKTTYTFLRTYSFATFSIVYNFSRVFNNLKAVNSVTNGIFKI